MKILDRLEKSTNFWFLLVTSFLFTLLRLPSLFEPYWYGDEGIYQTIGLGLRNGRILYKEIWDNKPPLLYFLYAAFNSDQFTIRLVSLISGLVAVFAFYFLAKKLFSSFYPTALFSFLFALPLIEGNIANSENFMLPLILLAGYCIVSYVKTPKKTLLYIAGLLLSLAFLFKAVAIFDLFAFSVFLFITQFKGKKHFFFQLITLFPLILSFSIPIAVTIIYFVLQGAFWDLYQATLNQNIGYVAYGNNLVFTKGFLLIKLALLAFGAFILFLRRKHIPAPMLFIFLWVFFSTFNAFFSQRPYTHYVLALLPSLMLLLGILLENPDSQAYKIKDFSKIKRMSLLFFIVISVLVIKNFHFYKKTILYYQNFISFVTNQKNVTSYLVFFDKNARRDYELASYIKMHAHPNDSLFIWGNNAQLYTLVNKLPPGRFTVAYHASANSQTLKETQHALLKTKPKYIVVVTSLNQPFLHRLSQYRQKITIYDAIVYERIF